MAIAIRLPKLPRVGLKGFAVLATVVLLGPVAYGKLSSTAENYYKMTACERRATFDDVQRVFNDIPGMKAAGLSLVDLSDRKRLSVTDTEVSCSASATLSDASERPLAYRFYKKDDQWLVEVRLSALPVERNSARD